MNYFLIMKLFIVKIHYLEENFRYNKADKLKTTSEKKCVL